MRNSVDKLAQFLITFLYDISFWWKFSVNRNINCDHFINKEYVNINEEPVINIYKDPFYREHICCLDAISVFEQYCGHKLNVIQKNPYIKEKQLYSVFLNIGNESHYSLILRSRNDVYVINLYGGSTNTFFVKHDYDDKLVNTNFKNLTNVNGIYPPYYLYDIQVKELNINSEVVCNIINSLIKSVEITFLPFFENRKEFGEIKKLIFKMRKWEENLDNE